MAQQINSKTMTNIDIANSISDLKISLGVYRAEVTSQNTVTNAHLINIDEHLAKMNGRLLTHDKEFVDSKLDRQALHSEIEAQKSAHIINCPIVQRVSVLERESGVKIGIKQFLIGGITLLAVLITMSFSILKINESIQQKSTEKQTQAIEKMIEAKVLERIQIINQNGNNK